MLVAGVEVGGSCTAAVFIKDVKTFDEMMDEFIAQRNQLGQTILGMRVALRDLEIWKRMLKQATSEKIELVACRAFAC